MGIEVLKQILAGDLVYDDHEDNGDETIGINFSPAGPRDLSFNPDVVASISVNVNVAEMHRILPLLDRNGTPVDFSEELREYDLDGDGNDIEDEGEDEDIKGSE